MNNKKLEDIKIKAEQLGEWMSLDLDTKSISEDMSWLVKTIENHQAEIDTLSMAHDNMARELSLFKEKDKHELIKANIALNKRVRELEEERDEWKNTAQSYYMTNQELREQNKRYREAINEFFDLDGDYKDIVNRAERMFIKVLDEIGG